MVPLIAVVVVLAVIGAVIVARRTVNQPSETRSSEAGDRSTSDTLYGSSDRPAGPDAEDPPTPTPNRTEPQAP